MGEKADLFTTIKIGRFTLNEHGFCQAPEFSMVETTNAGIFACGVFSGPKDIPEMFMQASGTTGKASALLAKDRGMLIKKRNIR